MNFMNVVERCVDKTEVVVDEQRCSIEENEVRFNEGQRLIGPDAGIAGVGCVGKARAARRFTGAGLTVFRDPRARKETHAKPVADGMFRDKKDLSNRSLGGFEEETGTESVDHSESERFLAREWFLPSAALANNLAKHR
jgi:hypothetical protein